MMSRLTVDRLGPRGEGVAQGPEGLIYVPYALAGETIAVFAAIALHEIPHVRSLPDGLPASGGNLL
jgi:tRNA/tmRNA/rRNA uracil-C5-methylase (TrmA/RlmC/RlmD family)